MTITLRQESADGASTKGSALTYAELDNNFIHLLRQGSVTVRGDSGTDQTLGEADKDSILQFVGGTNVTTTLSSSSAGETVVTIDATDTGISNVVEDTSPQLGGNLDVNGQSIVSASAGNITITPDTTGSIVLDGLNWPQADGTTGQVLYTNGSGTLAFKTITEPTGSELENVVEDTTPQLGGDLDVNGQNITSASNGNVSIVPNGSGKVVISRIVYDEIVFTGLGTTGTITPAPGNGSIQKITLTGNITINALGGTPAAGDSVTVIIVQPSSGGPYTLTSTMKFAGGTKTLSTAADAIDILTIVYDGTNYYASLSTNFS